MVPVASAPVETKQLQPAEDEKIQSEVRSLELFIAEHVKCYYNHSKDGDRESIFGFRPRTESGVEVALRRYIATQILHISNLKPFERSSAQTISNFPLTMLSLSAIAYTKSEPSVEGIREALVKYRRVGTEDACIGHLEEVLNCAVGLEKLLRSSPSRWEFGSLELKKSKCIDVIAFPFFSKDGEQIRSEACETVVIYPDDTPWKTRAVRLMRASNSAVGSAGSKSPTLVRQPSNPPLFQGDSHKPSDRQVPMFQQACRTNSGLTSNPPNQENIYQKHLTAPLLLLDLVIYLLCLVREALKGSVGRLEPGNIAVPAFTPELPLRFAAFEDHISEVMKESADNDSRSSASMRGGGGSQPKASSEVGAHTNRGGGVAAGDNMGQDRGHPSPRNEEVGDRKNGGLSKNSGLRQKDGGRGRDNRDQQSAGEFHNAATSDIGGEPTT